MAAMMLKHVYLSETTERGRDVLKHQADDPPGLFPFCHICAASCRQRARAHNVCGHGQLQYR